MHIRTSSLSLLLAVVWTVALATQAYAPIVSMNVTLPSASRTGLPSALPVRAFPAARMNMTATVTAVQAIPAGLGWAWCPAARVSPDWMAR